ncbi:MAG: chorismate synthase [Candidatus Brocadiia bacterium]
MRIVIAGMKCSGKSTLAQNLSNLLDISCVETDDVAEELYQEENGEALSCREICEQHGEDCFRNLESLAVQKISALQGCILSLGGSTFLVPEHRRKLCDESVLIWLDPDPETLWERIRRTGIPPFLREDGAKEKFFRKCELASDIVAPIAHITCDTSDLPPEEVARQVAQQVVEEIHCRMKSPNTLGEIIRVTTFGESHGPAMGVVMDGLKPGIEIDDDFIRHELARRRPGQSHITTSRDEKDQFRIISGVFEGKTTGMPLAIIIENRDADSSKYDKIRDIFRPGHADFTFWKKYAIRDHRGGGRSSGRETVSRVAAGAIARTKLQREGVTLKAWTEEIAGIRAQKHDFEEIENNPVRCPDSQAAKKMEEAIVKARQENDSVGGIIRLQITGLPAGLGDPVFGKLDARLTGSLMTLGAVKGIEIGAGFGVSRMRGSENNDEISADGFETNNAGGVLGGISTGQPIELRLAVKPTPSISQEQKTVDIQGNERQMHIEGRHDPCIAPRLVPVVESMAALVLLDAWAIQERLRDARIESEGEISGGAEGECGD